MVILFQLVDDKHVRELNSLCSNRISSDYCHLDLQIYSFAAYPGAICVFLNFYKESFHAFKCFLQAI
jgi:hypothetical protein